MGTVRLFGCDGPPLEDFRCEYLEGVFRMRPLCFTHGYSPPARNEAIGPGDQELVHAEESVYL